MCSRQEEAPRARGLDRRFIDATGLRFYQMPMAKPADTTAIVSIRPLVIAVAALFGALAAAAGIMWIWFGTKLFFEMVAAGIAYCF